MKYWGRGQKSEQRRNLLRKLEIYHAKVHPEGIRIMPEAQGDWMRNREDIKCCRFCGRWFIKTEKPKNKVIRSHLDLKD